MVRSIRLENDAFLGSWFGFTSYKHIAVFYLGINGIRGHWQDASGCIKANTVKKASSGIETMHDQAGTLDSESVRASLTRFELARV